MAKPKAKPLSLGDAVEIERAKSVVKYNRTGRSPLRWLRQAGVLFVIIQTGIFGYHKSAVAYGHEAPASAAEYVRVRLIGYDPKTDGGTEKQHSEDGRNSGTDRLKGIVVLSGKVADPEKEGRFIVYGTLGGIIFGGAFAIFAWRVSR
jgi:hypothetical protein